MRQAHVAIASCFALLLAACPSPSDDDAGGAGGGAEPAWRVIFDDAELDRAVLSIWGVSSKSVFAVGGPLGNTGRQALVLHHDGSRWKDLEPGGDETFWWVHGTSDSDVWMVGERGRIDHYDGASFTSAAPLTSATLWGVMALGPSDVWAVGGTPGGKPEDEDDVVLHWDGTTWARETLPGTPLRRALFKVWGTSSDDLHVVGEAGVMWHRTAAGWILDSDPPIASGTLFTVHGCGPNEVYAVGGSDLLKNDGAGWVTVDVALVNGANGVACSSEGSNGAVVVVGNGGLKRRLVGAEWVDDFSDAPHGDLHAVWADELGAFWAVGGDFISKPKPGEPRRGTIARFGPGRTSDVLE